MVFHLKVTVNDVLQRHTFLKAKVAAGEKGLNRIIKWAHAMEVTQIGKLLNGNELILSTGMAWKDNEESFFSFVQELIEMNVSALCIELGTHLAEIPVAILKLADDYDFPVIVFYEEVRFIDITQDLHTYLIQQQYQMITILESFSQALNQYLLEADPQMNILNHLYQSLQTQVIFICNQNKTKFFPSLSQEDQEELMGRIWENQVSPHLVRQPIQALDHQLAELIVYSEEEELSELDLLLIDRTATALANQLLREMYNAEKKKSEENTWMQEWFEEMHRDEEVERHLTHIGLKGKQQGATVFCIELEDDADISDTQYPYIQIVIRSIFAQLGFFILPYVKRDQLVFILVNVREGATFKDRLHEGIMHVKQNKKIPAVHMAAGKLINRLCQMNKSYETAQKALHLQKKLAKGKVSPLYDDLHMYRLISMIHEKEELHDFVVDYLHPVLDYDEKNKNSRLLKTLKIYLMCNGSKQETAGNLFIVRQTLYHRIKQLEELLGNDFMEPGKRQALEFAAMAHEYLQLQERV